jgi:hypothetical protein
MRALDVRGLSCLAALLLGVSASCLAGCATGTSGEPEDTGPRMDANRDAMTIDARADATPTDAPPGDAPPVDAPGTDAFRIDAAGDMCGAVTCTGFTHCVAGRCEDYPACRGDGTCATAGDVCIARRCVPGTVDIDGDGSPASADCDETDPTRSPLIVETCNLRDDDCDMMVDDGDTTALCAMDAEGGICIAGTCDCPAGTFDIDRTVSGCECTASPAAATGDTCATAIDLGPLSDAGAGQVMTAMGNALPAGREVWYHFTAVDSPDSSCDNYRVRVHFTVNPGMAYDFYVRQGACGSAISCGGFGEGFQDYVLATDFRADIGGGVLGGECPCTPAGAPVDNVSPCSDNSAEYFVRVRRAPGAALSCSAYTLEVSNGI